MLQIWSYKSNNPINGRTKEKAFLTESRIKTLTQSFYHFCMLGLSSVPSLVSDSLQPHDCSTPGFPVHHQLPVLAQTHVHRVSDAIQPSHPQSSPSSPAFSLSQDQGLFKWVGSPHHVAKLLEFQLQHQRPIAFFSYFPFLWLILCYISLTLARKSCLAFKGS